MRWLGLLVALLIVAGLHSSVPPALAQTGTQSGVRGDPSRCPPPFPGAKNWSCPTGRNIPPNLPQASTGSPGAGTLTIPPECRTHLNPVELYRNPDFLDQIINCVLGAQPAQAATQDPCGTSDGTMRLGALLDGRGPQESPQAPGNPRLNPFWNTWYSNWYLVLEDCIYKKTMMHLFAGWLFRNGHQSMALDEWYCVKIGYEISANKKLTMTGADYHAHKPWTRTASDKYYYEFVKENFMSMDGKAPSFPAESKAKAVRRHVVLTVGNAPITPVRLQGTDQIVAYLCPNERPPAHLEPDLIY
jgi:hypothetical protein